MTKDALRARIECEVRSIVQLRPSEHSQDVVVRLVLEHREEAAAEERARCILAIESCPELTDYCMTWACKAIEDLEADGDA